MLYTDMPQGHKCHKGPPWLPTGALAQSGLESACPTAAEGSPNTALSWLLRLAVLPALIPALVRVGFVIGVGFEIRLVVVRHLDHRADRCEELSIATRT